MIRSFQEELQVLLNSASSDVREHVEQNINIALKAGICSFADSLSVIQDEEVDVYIREAICWLLGQLKYKQSVYVLLKIFQNQSGHLRRQAAHTLGLINSKRAVKPLITTLREAKSTEQRTDAAYALGLLRDERATEQLLHTLTNVKEDTKVRAQSAEALAYIDCKDHRILDALTAALADQNIEIRFWSVFALGEISRIDNQEVLRELERLAENDTSILPGWWSISEEATTALDRIRERGDNCC